MSKALTTTINGTSHYFVGIDPDTEKSGVAVVEKESRKLECAALSFADTLDYLHWLSERSAELGNPVKVFIEAGWLNRSNWHLQRGDTKAVVAAKGLSQGRNEQVSRLLGEMCERYGLTYAFIKPYRKCWSGPNRKITHEELAAFTGIMGRTNQEMRDAALIAWLQSGLPIRVKPQRRTKNE
ncbi:MAG: hypothetical protein IIT64_10210 [Bacteroidaceae bacterium]|nr:hypothetical protein [Bacteroidaceae bacterium]